MAPRKRNWIDPKTREKIKTTKIIQRLQAYALGEKEDKANAKGEYKDIEMSPAQVKAAHILINKRLPDLTAADINHTQDMPESKQEVYEKLVEALGEELALKIAPEFLPSKRTLN